MRQIGTICALLGCCLPRGCQKVGMATSPYPAEMKILVWKSLTGCAVSPGKKTLQAGKVPSGMAVPAMNHPFSFTGGTPVPREGLPAQRVFLRGLSEASPADAHGSRLFSAGGTISPPPPPQAGGTVTGGCSFPLLPSRCPCRYSGTWNDMRSGWNRSPPRLRGGRGGNRPSSGAWRFSYESSHDASRHHHG